MVKYIWIILNLRISGTLLPIFRAPINPIIDHHPFCNASLLHRAIGSHPFKTLVQLVTEHPWWVHREIPVGPLIVGFNPSDPKIHLVGGWATYPSEKMMEFVNWDDDNIWKVIKMFQTTNQTLVYVTFWILITEIVEEVWNHQSWNAQQNNPYICTKNVNGDFYPWDNFDKPSSQFDVDFPAQWPKLIMTLSCDPSVTG